MLRETSLYRFYGEPLTNGVVVLYFGSNKDQETRWELHPSGRDLHRAVHLSGDGIPY